MISDRIIQPYALRAGSAAFVEDTHESGGEGALLYIDLDDFKHINDGLGHQYGDILLKNISSGLKQIPV